VSPSHAVQHQEPDALVFMGDVGWWHFERRHSAGNVALMASSNTNGISVSYAYDNLDRLSTVVGPSASSGAQYDHIRVRSGQQSRDRDVPQQFSIQLTLDDLNRLKIVNGYRYQFGLTDNQTSATKELGRSVTGATTESTA
jgi:hypothetical protein